VHSHHGERITVICVQDVLQIVRLNGVSHVLCEAWTGRRGAAHPG
jgi:hypothetical protein